MATKNDPRKVTPGPNDFVFDLYGRTSYDRGSDDDYRFACLTTYGRSWARGERHDREGRYFIPEHLSFSDYSGCMVERANVKAFEEMFSDGEDAWWFRAIGGHGTEAIVVDSHAIPDEAVSEVDDVLSGLYDYPSIDDEVVSEMETEAEQPAWDSWVKSDLIRELAERVEGREWPRDDLSEVEDSKLRRAFEDVRERANLYWETEQGGGRYVDVRRVAAEFSDEEIAALLA